MNSVVLMGRLTRDPEVRYTQSNEPLAIAKFTLAVDRRHRSNNSTGNGANEQNADFINCTAFGKSAEFAEKYYHKGIKIVVRGRIQTGSYVNKDGQKVYTTDVVVEDQEFAESKASSGGGGNAGGTQAAPNQGYQGNVPQPAGSSFMNIPEGIDAELPF